MCPHKKQNFYKTLYINQISPTNIKSFSNQRPDTASILSSLNSSLTFFYRLYRSFYMKHIFMVSTLFKSHPIRHSDMGHAFKDTQRALDHLDTRTLGHLESTQGALWGHLGTQAFGVHSGSWALKALGHSDT